MPACRIMLDNGGRRVEAVSAGQAVGEDVGAGCCPPGSAPEPLRYSVLTSIALSAYESQHTQVFMNCCWVLMSHNVLLLVFGACPLPPSPYPPPRLPAAPPLALVSPPLPSPVAAVPRAWFLAMAPNDPCLWAAAFTTSQNPTPAIWPGKCRSRCLSRRPHRETGLPSWMESPPVMCTGVMERAPGARSPARNPSTYKRKPLPPPGRVERVSMCHSPSVRSECFLQVRGGGGGQQVSGSVVRARGRCRTVSRQQRVQGQEQEWQKELGSEG